MYNKSRYGMAAKSYWGFLTIMFSLFLGEITYCQQQELKRVTPEEYHKWYHLGIPLVSDNGLWAGYKLNYIIGSDTLIIKQILGQKEYVFPGGSRFLFIGKKWASYKDHQNLIHLINLTNGKHEELVEVNQVLMSDKEHFLILFKKQKEEVIIRDLLKETSTSIKNVSDFTYDNKSNSILMSLTNQAGYAIELLYLNSDMKTKQILKSQSRKIKKIKWVDDKGSLVYILEPLKTSADTLDSGILGYYNVKKRKRSEMNLAKVEGFPKNYSPTISRQFQLHMSKDGRQIFFLYKRKEPLKYDDIPEVWKWDDPYIHKKMVYQMNWENTDMIGIWDMKKNLFSKLTDSEFPKAILSPNQEYALLYNPATYEPQSRAYAPVDLYLKNLKTGQINLILEKHQNDLKSVHFSPLGRYILYFKHDQWWYYDIKNDAHINLNQRFNTVRKLPLYYNSAIESVPPGWGEGEKTIYMYDEFDLWRIPLGNGDPVRITDGRKEGIHYKLITEPKFKLDNNEGAGIIKEDQQLIFHLNTGDNEQSGFAIKNPREKTKVISFEKSFTHPNWNQISKDGSMLIFLEENNNVPQRIMSFHIKTNRLDTVFQGNPHYSQYKHGISKKVYYTNKYGKKLSGILRYPIDFDKDSIYPMVVHVYETQKSYLHRYTIPGWFNGIGYNPSNLVNEGYFVFLPDIEYEIGEPGFSAADCIISGTKAVIESAPVNPDKIALFGHSFGGYETLFTITQTNLFKTAISGSGNGDMIGSYLHIDNGSSLNFDDFEFSQYRMGKSLFDDYQGYLDNSPLYHAKKIQTPLLLWSGKEDHHVYYYQSISFHLAMKRLGKKTSLLLYPGEDHVFSKPENQKDLTIRIQQWLGHYLKNDPKQGWMP